MRVGRALVERGALSLGVALAMAHPVLRAPQQLVLGSSHTDTVKHVWTLWLGRTLLREEGRLWGPVDLINHPVGMRFYVIEPLGALVAALLPLGSLPLVANLLALVNLLLLGLCAGFAVEQAGGDRWAGHLGALLALGCSATAFVVHLGVGELQHLFLLPLVLGLLLRLRERPGPGGAIALGLAVGVAVACGLYLGLMAAQAALLGGLVLLAQGPRRGRLLLALLGAAVLAALLALPVLAGLRENWSGLHDAFDRDTRLLRFQGTPLDGVGFRQDLLGALVPLGPPATMPTPAYYGGQYLGPVLLGLAGLGLLRRPRAGLVLLLPALAAFLLSLGTRPVWGGAELPFPEGQALPYAWLKHLLAAIAAAPHHPSRFSILTAMALAALGGLAVAGLPGWRRPALGLLLGLGAFLDLGLRVPGALPLPTSRQPPMSALVAAIRAEPGPVLDLSYALRRDIDLKNRTAWFQLGHGQPTQAVPIAQLDALAPEGAARALALPLLQDLRALHGAREEAHLPGDYDVDLALLREDGFRWLLLYGSPDVRPQAIFKPGERRREGPPRGPLAALDALLGPPAVLEDAAAAWRIPEVVVDEERLRAARERRDRRAKEIGDDVFAH